MKRLIVFLVLLLAVNAFGAGQSDTTTLADYLDSFFSRTASYTATPWDLDPDSSNIRQAINDALLDVSTNPLLTDATSSQDTIITDSSRWYSLPADFFEIKRATIIDPTKNGEMGLRPIAEEELGKKTSPAATSISFYIIDGQGIQFDPNNVTGDTVFIYYRPLAAQLDTNAAVSNVIKKYKTLVVDLGIINFFGGRTGADVANVIAQAKDRIAIFAAKLGIKPEKLLPDIR